MRLWNAFKKVGFGAVTGAVLAFLNCPFYGWRFWVAIIALHLAWVIFPPQKAA